jgi:hypothetical protein
MGEMFLTFPIDKKIWSWSGVDVTQLRPHIPTPPDEGQSRAVLRWEQLFMELRPPCAMRFGAFIGRQRKSLREILRMRRTCSMKTFEATLPHAHK